MCQPCTYCGDGVANVIQECTSKTDRICGPCKRGYIKDGYGNCEPCKNYPPGMYSYCDVTSVQPTPEVTTTTLPENDDNNYKTKQPLITETNKGEAVTKSVFHRDDIDTDHDDNRKEEKVDEMDRRESNKEAKGHFDSIYIIIITTLISFGLVTTVVYVVTKRHGSNSLINRTRTISLTSIPDDRKSTGAESSSQATANHKNGIVDNATFGKLLQTEGAQNYSNVEAIRSNQGEFHEDTDQCVTSAQVQTSSHIVNEEKKRKNPMKKNKKTTTCTNLRVPDRVFRRTRSKSGDSEPGEGQQLLSEEHMHANDALDEDEVFGSSTDNPCNDPHAIENSNQAHHIVDILNNDGTVKASLPNLAVSSKKASLMVDEDQEAIGVAKKNSATKDRDGIKQVLDMNDDLQEKKRKKQFSKRLATALELANDKPLTDLFNDESAYYDVVSLLTPSLDTGHKKYYQSLLAEFKIPHKHWNRFRGPKDLLEHVHSSLTEGKRDVARLLAAVRAIDRIDIVYYLIEWIFKIYEYETEL
ncbi:uncharacterized protein LOC144438533 isoform X2 [Glandiceps talaboti]